jgi:hypothetical protein
MSYLNGPRINFWGGGSTNVDTANNAGDGIVDLVNTVVVLDRPDDYVTDLLRSPTLNGDLQPYYTLGGWNYYGDHQVAWLGAKVSSAGAPGAVTQSDKLVSLPVYLLGSVDPVSGEGPYGGPVMVDLDPTSSQTTQIYVGGLQIGGGDTPALKVVADTRCHSHFLGLHYDPGQTAPPYLTPGSAWANGTFQLAFPRAAITHYDASYPTLAAIVDAPGAIGIVVRFCMFEFMPGMSTADLLANYAASYNDSNPSLGRIIGTVGPWFADEPATCPPGRLLQNTAPGGAQGVAHLDTAGGRLTLDLSSALQGSAIRSDPKNVTAPIGPNVDYGNLQIGAGGKVLATTPSLPADYYLFGGVYDVALDVAAATALAGAPIEITASKGNLQIDESPLRVYSNDRNIYLDDVGGAAALELLVRHLGGPMPQDVTFVLDQGSPGILPAGSFLQAPGTVTVPAGATSVTVDVKTKGDDAGFVALNVTLGGVTAYFINFRKYPADDFSKEITAGGLKWEFVYERTLRFYYVLFPAMSKRIPLNDEPTIRATAGEILKRLSPQYHDTTLRMPVTRSLSPGKVALLTAFLQQPQSGGG